MRCATIGLVIGAAWLVSTSSPATGADPAPTMTARDGSTMVLVPAGPFVMGSGLGRDDETPPHRVELPAFYIDKMEVTAGQYARFLKATGVKPPPGWSGPTPPAGREQFPIANITWFDAMRYAIWAGKRLPTEAEWEKAARGTDGRLYPWGDVDDPGRRRLDVETSAGDGLGPVGQLPEGASPYGCLDMSGNAWEWTADWYKPYPHSAANLVHFGEQYKVIRGGGGIYFYGAANTGRCTQRARLVPYGAYDALGFRCVADVDPAAAPYDPQKLLEAAEARLEKLSRQPIRLAQEDEFDGYRRAGRVPVRIVGAAGRRAPVRAGFPLPRGLLKDEGDLRMLDDRGRPVPVSAAPLSRWEDDSLRWVLLNFTAEGERSCEVDFSGRNRTPDAPRATVRITEAADGITLDTQRIRAVLARDGLLREYRAGGRVLAGPMTVTARIETEQGPQELRALPAEELLIEENAPLYATVRLKGTLGDAQGQPSVFKYDLRVLAAADSGRLNLLLTVWHHAARTEPFEEAAPVVRVSRLEAAFGRRAAASAYGVGTESGVVALPAAGAWTLEQPDDLHYTLRQAESFQRDGTRAAGWLAALDGDAWLVTGVRHFWQNCPKSLAAGDDAVRIGLWAGSAAFEWEAGLAKTHELVLDVAASEGSASAPPVVDLDPLRMTMPPAWACGTEAAGAVLARSREMLATFPYWECWRESDLRTWMAAMPAGMRDFGDGYMGGPHKGKNAYQNLEYDIAYNFLIEFLRTGQPWYLQAAEPMARHQVDIDTDNFSGRPWKHSPQHTTNEAEFGHVFCRGLMMHYLLTGERRTLEVARRTGDYIAQRLERHEGVGNERQIGWSLYHLTGLYEVTREPRYLRAAETLCRRLIEGQSPTGKFDIRWDNRIAFFNGIAMNGMLSVQEHNRDAALTDGVLRVARRTLGFYPEYACRTLNAFCWALDVTGDPRYLDAMERVWNSSMEFLWDRSVAPEMTHMWRFPMFAARYGLFTMFAGERDRLPDPATWRGMRLKSPLAEVHVRATSADARVLVLREGLTTGSVQMLDEAGREVSKNTLDRAAEYFQGVLLDVPAGSIRRLRMSGPAGTSWQVQHDAGAAVTVYDPAGLHLAALQPRAFGAPLPGATEVKLRFEALGEGFHSATLHDAAGNPVAVVRHFIDFGDPGRYELELKAAVPSGQSGWSVSLHNLKVLSVEGMGPYWAASPESLFLPERMVSP